MASSLSRGLAVFVSTLINTIMKKYIKIPTHIPLSVISEAVEKFLSSQKLVETKEKKESAVEQILNKMNSVKTEEDAPVEQIGLEAFLKGETAETISDETVKDSYLNTVVTWLGRNANGAETTLEQLLNVLGLSDLLPEVVQFAEDALKAEAEQAATALPENPDATAVLPESLPMPEDEAPSETIVRSESVDATVAFMNRDKNLTEATLKPDSAIRKLASAHFDGDVKATKAFAHSAQGTPNYDAAVKALASGEFAALTDGEKNNVLWLDVKELSSDEGEIVGEHIVKIVSGSSLKQDRELIDKLIRSARLSKSEIESLAWSEAQELEDNEFVTVEKYDPAKIKAKKEEDMFLAKVTKLRSAKIIGEEASADLKTIKSLVAKIEGFQASDGKKVGMITKKELALAFEMLANQISALNTDQGLAVAKNVE